MDLSGSVGPSMSLRSLSKALMALSCSVGPSVFMRGPL